MCRSIKTLRPPVLPEEATEEDIRAAALQYVRKVSGFRAPAAHNREVFDRAVEEIAGATARLLRDIEVRGAGTATGAATASGAHVPAKAGAASAAGAADASGAAGVAAAARRSA